MKYIMPDYTTAEAVEILDVRKMHDDFIPTDWITNIEAAGRG
jgi:hypothetical protein